MMKKGGQDVLFRILMLFARRSTEDMLKLSIFTLIA